MNQSSQTQSNQTQAQEQTQTRPRQTVSRKYDSITLDEQNVTLLITVIGGVHSGTKLFIGSGDGSVDANELAYKEFAAVLVQDYTLDELRDYALSNLLDEDDDRAEARLLDMPLQELAMMIAESGEFEYDDTDIFTCTPDEITVASPKKYKIVRHFYNSNAPSLVVMRDLSLEAARKHCNDPSTRAEGNYFDGFEEE